MLQHSHCHHLLLLLLLAELGSLANAQCSPAGKDCTATKCCATAGHKCYEKDEYWASCKDKCTPGIDPNDPPQYRTPWSCKVLSGGTPPPVVRRRRTAPVPTGRRRRTQNIPDAPSGTPVAWYGSLKVKGNKVTDKNGKPVQLHGMSLFWSQWKSQYYTEDTVKWLAKDWQISIIRAAMAVEEGGYLTDPDAEMKRVETVVDASIKYGIYVIIDWHDHKAEKHTSESINFFAKVAEKYGQYPNVIFEPYNEPVKQSWKYDIKPYHEAVVPMIRAHSDNLIILGTRSWSQEVVVAKEDPVPGTNLAYTLHFYASSAPHQAPLRQAATSAMSGSDGIAIFITEWGTCEYTGDGNVDLQQTQTWLDFLKKNHISYANWAIGDKAESCAALKPGASGNGGWKESELTKSGKFMRETIKKAAPKDDDMPKPSPTSRRRRRGSSRRRRRRGTRRRSSKSRRRRRGGKTRRRRR